MAIATRTSGHSQAYKVTTGIRARKLARTPHHPTGDWCRDDLRLALYLRDDFRCGHCGADLRRVPHGGRSLDHVIPRVDRKTGQPNPKCSNRPDNLVTSCGRCNYSRQDKPCPRNTVARIRPLLALDIKPYRLMARQLIAKHGSYARVVAAIARRAK